MISVRNNPEALAREVAKWSPDIVYRALAMDNGKALPIAGYFIGTGIDILDPGIWQGLALHMLRIEARKLLEAGIIDEFEQIDIQNLLSSDPGEANKRIIIHKIRSRR